MSPPAVMIVLGRRVGRVVDEHPRAADELDEIAPPICPLIVRRACAELVVGDVHKCRRTIVALGESIAERTTRVPNLEGTHLVSIRRATALGELTEVDLGIQLI